MGSERAAGDRHRDGREGSPASRRRHQRALAAPPRVPATRPRRSGARRPRCPEVKGSAREPGGPRDGASAQGPSRRRRPRAHKLTNAPSSGQPASGPASGSGAASNRVLLPFPGSSAVVVVVGAPGSTGDRRARTAACTLTRRRPLPRREHGAVQGVLGSGCSVGLGRRPWNLCHPAAAAGSLWFCVAGPSVRALEREEHS